jgi:hypothetical protein
MPSLGIMERTTTQLQQPSPTGARGSSWISICSNLYGRSHYSARQSLLLCREGRDLCAAKQGRVSGRLSRSAKVSLDRRQYGRSAGILGGIQTVWFRAGNGRFALSD